LAEIIALLNHASNELDLKRRIKPKARSLSLRIGEQESVIFSRLAEFIHGEDVNLTTKKMIVLPKISVAEKKSLWSGQGIDIYGMHGSWEMH
jgi:hypothetical protein